MGTGAGRRELGGEADGSQVPYVAGETKGKRETDERGCRVGRLGHRRQ